MTSHLISLTSDQLTPVNVKPSVISKKGRAGCPTQMPLRKRTMPVAFACKALAESGQLELHGSARKYEKENMT